MIIIRPAEIPNDLTQVRMLFREYADNLGVDLCFQGFDAELADLPDKYAAPTGRLLLAWRDHDAVGCVAMRGLDTHSCEMKRLYVRPQARGEQLGRRLAERVCSEARAAGYSRICLDTLPTMTAAQQLYRTLGFVHIEPYVFNPIPGTLFLGLELSGRCDRSPSTA
jgi:GNAT superfamily N-acetyltransferase